MFTRKLRTVASVMSSFTKIVTDLEDIITATIAKNVILNEERAALDEEIQAADLEIHQARGTAARLNDLLYGEPKTNG